MQRLSRATYNDVLRCKPNNSRRPRPRLRAHSQDDVQSAWLQQEKEKIQAFVVPALVIPMADPLMSVIDTVCIGQFAGTRELAALAPAAVLFAFAQYTFQALQIATISLVGDALRLDQWREAGALLGTALWVAALAGLATALLFEAVPERLIALTGANTQLVPLAASYTRIRALAQPAVMLSMVAQGGLLAQRDALSPCSAVAAAVIASVVGNVVAVGLLGLGLAGAAATTVAAQLLAGVMLLRALTSKRDDRVLPAWQQVPQWADLRRLAATVGPLSIAYLSKNLCYGLIQTTAAGLQVVQLAAHQAVFSVWNLCAFTSAPIEQAALAFVPRAQTQWQRRGTVRLMLGLGLLMGITCGVAVTALVVVAPQLLTRDTAVWPHIASLAPQALASMLLIGVDVAASGSLLAMRDVAYVARSFVITLAALAAFLVAHVGVLQGGVILTDVWWAIVVFFLVRCVQSCGRVAWHLANVGSWVPAASGNT